MNTKTVGVITPAILDLLKGGARFHNEWIDGLPLLCAEYPDVATVWWEGDAVVLEGGSGPWVQNRVTLVPNLEKRAAYMWACQTLATRLDKRNPKSREGYLSLQPRVYTHMVGELLVSTTHPHMDILTIEELAAALVQTRDIAAKLVLNSRLWK